MRIIGEIPHRDCKITLFSWNNRYLIKVEQGLLEQTFKIDQFELTGASDLQGIVNETFINETLARFQSMELTLRNAIERQ